MARRPRVFEPGLLYHVIVRGNQRQKTFWNKRDYQAYLDRFARYREKFGVTVYAYCLMPNHAHLLVECSSEPLSKFMQALQQTYTQYFNRRHEKVGHLFQGRYHAIVCAKDEYLLALVRYIHLNPVRAGLAKTPEEYLYTGHGEYCGMKEVPIIDRTLVLGMLGGKNAYQRFIMDGIGQGHKDAYYEVEDQRFLGPQGFGDSVAKRLCEEEHVRLKRKPLVEPLAVLTVKLRINAEALAGPDRSWKASRARAVIGYVLVRRLGYPLVEVARCLGRDVSSVSSLISRLGDRIESEVVLAKEIETLRQDCLELKA